MRVLPDHSSKTLVQYGRRLFDAATRLYRGDPTDEAAAVVRSATDALLAASRTYAGASRDYFVTASKQLNDSAAFLNKALAARGKAPFSFVTAKQLDTEIAEALSKEET